ncbi:MAG: histidine kinase [Burkholderiales bacterium]|nr:histidine kinase [Burkholderiales bacterium]
MSDLSSSAASTWKRLSANAVLLFHTYANWLVGISWKRFFLLSLLLMIGAGVLSDVLPSWTVTELRDAPASPRPPHVPSITIDKGSRGADHDDVTISIDKDGVRIGPRARAVPGAAAAASTPASASASASAASGPVSAASAASAASDAVEAVITRQGSVEIKLPPGATSEVVKQAVQEARSAIVDAIEESRQAARDAADAAREAADASRSGTGQIVHTRRVHFGESLPQLAFFFIVASLILKITYKGRIQAEVKAAAATETAESEQLKRQVVEARMAAMQAQVEPHFLFNTLASIDHLIETDPARASQMQKNLIALLRASMPAMRENHPTAHNLGREMAVIRPYLEILKVRMEDRLRTEIDVPDGLLSADFPPMMIQSLVENAIKHGLEPKPEGGTLAVRAEILHGKLAVTVADTGLGFGKAATAGTGVGLNNIRERLQLLYGAKASMTVAENSPSGTVVTLTVPYQAQPRNEGTSA